MSLQTTVLERLLNESGDRPLACMVVLTGLGPVAGVVTRNSKDGGYVCLTATQTENSREVRKQNVYFEGSQIAYIFEMPENRIHAVSPIVTV